jgi:hypothetical protein
VRAAAAGDYLVEVARKLEETGGVFKENPLVELNEAGLAGNLDASIHYHDGSRLEVTLTVVFTSDYPEWSDYSFHYMDANHRCIFRYDNTPHHPNHAFFPHHKHVGHTPVDHPQPSIATIVSEILDHLASSVSG